MTNPLFRPVCGIAIPANPNSRNEAIHISIFRAIRYYVYINPWDCKTLTVEKLPELFSTKSEKKAIARYNELVARHRPGASHVPSV